MFQTTRLFFTRLQQQQSHTRFIRTSVAVAVRVSGRHRVLTVGMTTRMNTLRAGIHTVTSVVHATSRIQTTVFSVRMPA